MKQEAHDPAILAKMRREWDERARTNARHYVATGRNEWSDEAFFESGSVEIEDLVSKDIHEICGERRAREMRVLEIGCGAGRMTRALSRIFGSVDAVDISAEMIAQARSALAGAENVRFHVNNGVDLSMLPDNSFDFALSAIVFQHIPRKSIVENYIRETCRVLKRGSQFKFQVQGGAIPEDLADTWVGAGFTESEIFACAASCGFDVRKSQGAGTQYFWNTFLKP